MQYIIIAINPKYDRYQRGLASIVCNFLDKKTGLEVKASVNEELSQELHKPVIKRFKRRKIEIIDNIWEKD